MANTFKKVIDRMTWVQVPPSPNAHAAGMSMASDLRNTLVRHPFAYSLHSNVLLNRYNIVTKAWQLATATPLTAGTIGVGSTSSFAPSFGATGTIASGGTSTVLTLETALPAAVGVNMLGNRGGSGETGFRVRIVDFVTGKTEERWIVGNTAGTTPAIVLDQALTFTPSSGARYELMSGRLFMLGAGANAAGIFRSYEPATNALATLSAVNLPGTVSTDSAMLVLDEQYVPYSNKPGEGMVKGTNETDALGGGCLAIGAAAATSTTITGRAADSDAVVAANEYRNFQIRIVEDTITPSAVGQRRTIASHTAGPSPVYTLGEAWSVTPSATVKFVIELPNLLVLRSSATTTTYTYNYTSNAIANGTNSITPGSWSTAYFAAPPAVNAAGCVWAPSWGILPDGTRNARHSFNYFWRGGSAALDLLDIAGSATGVWTGSITYDGANNSFLVGATGCYAPFSEEGRFTYLNLYVASAINQIYRFDAKYRVLSPYTPTDFVQSGTATGGSRMTAYAAIDGNDKYSILLLQSQLSTIAQELIPLV